MFLRGSIFIHDCPKSFLSLKAPQNLPGILNHGYSILGLLLTGNAGPDHKEGRGNSVNHH
jgi:hypothetical protein